MPWNNAVEQCRAHQGRFHSPRCFSDVRVRRKGSGAHGTPKIGCAGWWTAKELQRPCVAEASRQGRLRLNLPLSRCGGDGAVGAAPWRGFRGGGLVEGVSRRRRCSSPPRAWNNAVEQYRAHQGRFHSPRCFSEARVRRKGSGAHGTEHGTPRLGGTRLGTTRLGVQAWCARGRTRTPKLGHRR